MKRIHDLILRHSSWYKLWHDKRHIDVWHLIIFFEIALLSSLAVLTAGEINLRLDLSFAGADSGNQRDTAQVRPEGRGVQAGFAPDRILVKFKQSLSATAKQKIRDSQSLKLIKSINGAGFEILAIADEDSPQEAIDKLNNANRGSLEFAEPDWLMEPAYTPNDPFYLVNQQPYMTYHRLEEAWDTIKGNPEVIVAVADSGIDCSHPDFGSQCVTGFNSVNDNSVDTEDIYGHGTRVAGTIKAVGDNGEGISGSLWSGKLMPLRITNDSLTGYAYWSDAAEAIVWAADRGARVVNLSYAASGSSTIQNAGSYLRSKGGLLVVSAGNSGAETGLSTVPSIIAVSATTLSDTRQSWSAFGDNIDISAYGCTFSTQRGGGYTSACGTSHSAPSTAGILALIFASRPGLTPAQAENMLFSTARDIGMSGWDKEFGWGVINAGAAVTAAVNSTPGNDEQSPNVSITAPDQGAILSGSVTIAANATDNVAVAGVQFLVDGVSLGGEDTTPPYSASWDTTKKQNGSYTLTAIASDTSDNQTTSQPVYVSISNQSVSAPLVITGYNISSKTASTAIIKWTTNIPATGTMFYGDSPSQLTQRIADTNVRTTHNTTIGGLPANSTIYYQIQAVSQDGSSSTQSPVSNFKTRRK